MNGHSVVDGRVGGHDDGAGRDDRPVVRFDFCRWAAFNSVHLRVAEDRAAFPLDAASQCRQILKRMKLTLPGKSQTRAGVK